MKERPINFNAEMVRALLDGRKTMTRRICKVKPIEGSFKSYGKEAMAAVVRNYCLYGKPGDRLWVREAYYQFGHWEPFSGSRPLTRKGRQRWKFVPDSEDIRYEMADDFRKGMHNADPWTMAWHKRLARFMPRKYARIWLEITDVRVERVQEISDDDAMAEGASKAFLQNGVELIPQNHIEAELMSYTSGFRLLWDSINAERGFGWGANPWVWVLGFDIVKGGRGD